MWDKYKDKVSSGPAKWTMARAINTGVCYPHSFVGCHAGKYKIVFKTFFTYRPLYVCEIGMKPRDLFDVLKLYFC